MICFDHPAEAVLQSLTFNGEKAAASGDWKFTTKEQKQRKAYLTNGFMAVSGQG